MNNKVLIKILNGEDAKNFVDPFYKINNKPHTAHNSDIFFCAFKNNQLIGTVRFCVEKRTPILRSMPIYEDYCFQGIGSRFARNKKFSPFLFL